MLLAKCFFLPPASPSPRPPLCPSCLGLCTIPASVPPANHLSEQIGPKLLPRGQTADFRLIGLLPTFLASSDPLPLRHTKTLPRQTSLRPLCSPVQFPLPTAVGTRVYSVSVSFHLTLPSQVKCPLLSEDFPGFLQSPVHGSTVLLSHRGTQIYLLTRPLPLSCLEPLVNRASFFHLSLYPQA